MNRFKILRTHKLDLKINKNAFGDENFCRLFGLYIYIYIKKPFGDTNFRRLKLNRRGNLCSFDDEP